MAGSRHAIRRWFATRKGRNQGKYLPPRSTVLKKNSIDDNHPARGLTFIQEQQTTEKLTVLRTRLGRYRRIAGDSLSFPWGIPPITWFRGEKPVHPKGEPRWSLSLSLPQTRKIPSASPVRVRFLSRSSGPIVIPNGAESREWWSEDYVCTNYFTKFRILVHNPQPGLVWSGTGRLYSGLHTEWKEKNTVGQ